VAVAVAITYYKKLPKHCRCSQIKFPVYSGSVTAFTKYGLMDETFPQGKLIARVLRIILPMLAAYAQARRRQFLALSLFLVGAACLSSCCWNRVH
jgi:hypothetical protein